MKPPQLLEAPHKVSRDPSDLIVIDELAASEAALLERVIDLEARNATLEGERRWYREIVLAAFHALHDLTRKLDRARELAAMRGKERSA